MICEAINIKYFEWPLFSKRVLSKFLLWEKSPALYFSLGNNHHAMNNFPSRFQATWQIFITVLEKYPGTSGLRALSSFPCSLRMTICHGLVALYGLTGPICGMLTMSVVLLDSSIVKNIRSLICINDVMRGSLNHVRDEDIARLPPYEDKLYD